MEGILTDDHVAELLAKEANDYSLRYSSMGLEGYRSPRRTTQPKPNTRFLRHIITETKNHNEALLVKEAAESQARLDSLAASKTQEERKHRPAAQDLRQRQLGSIAATLQGMKRKLDVLEGVETPSRKRDPTKLDAHREYVSRQDAAKRREDRAAKNDGRGDRDRSRGRERDRDKERRHRKLSSSERGRLCGSSHKRSSRRDEDRSKSPPRQERKDRHSHSHRQKPRHKHRGRSRTPSEDGSGTENRSTSRKRRRQEQRRGRESGEDTNLSSPRQPRHQRRDEDRQRADSPDRHDDSDPLEELIGPKPSTEPQVRRRGRGAASGPAAMDSRFSESYDPKFDVQLDSKMDVDGDDWDEALEALRDRQKWKQQGAERLRAAGFTGEQIKAWERSEGGREKSAEDVRWAKPGEGREWDRGKVMGVVGSK